MKTTKFSNPSKKIQLKCSNGHCVHSVHSRKVRSDSMITIPYFYCPECNVFFEPVLSVVKKVHSKGNEK